MLNGRREINYFWRGMNYLWQDINYHVILRQGWGGGIGDCEINIVAKRINPSDQQQIIIKHAYEKMLLKTFSFGTQIRTFTNSNDFLQIKLIPVHSDVIPMSFRCHSGSFQFIPIHSGVIPVHYGPFHLIPVHSAPFRCLVTSYNKVLQGGKASKSKLMELAWSSVGFEKLVKNFGAFNWSFTNN